MKSAKQKFGGMFPDRLIEVEQVTEILIEHAEALSTLEYDSKRDTISWGAWIHLIQWLRPKIIQYDPDSWHELNWNDLEECQQGYQRDLLHLYLLLLNYADGIHWDPQLEHERLAAENELLLAILKVKAHLDDSGSSERDITKNKRRKTLSLARWQKGTPDWHTKAITDYKRLLESGKPKRALAAILAAKYDKSPQQVRKIIKKANL